MRFPARAGLAFICASTALGACRRPVPQVAGGEVPTVAVTVTTVSPAEVSFRDGIPVELLIVGAGFDPTSNTVSLGPITLTTIPSEARGTRIRFTVPDRVPSGGGAAPLLWEQGVYTLTVQTRLGTSAPVSVRVVEP